MSEILESGSSAGWAQARSLILLNPALVCDDAHLLQALGLRPHAPNVVEFGPAALARLSAARERESEARQEVEAIARANFSAQGQAHDLVLDLLAAANSADLAWRLHEGAQRRFGLEIASVGVEGQPGGAELFGEAAERVRSVALVRLSLGDPKRAGLVAFGSADPDGFTNDMGVELIAFVGQVVERLAERWLARN